MCYIKITIITVFILFHFVYTDQSNWHSKNFNDNQFIKVINDAFLKFNSCNSENCLCFQSIIDNDLNAFKESGISKRMIDLVSSRGVRYQIIENKLYRDKNCMFPTRCAGIEHFLLKLITQLPNTEMIINVRDYPQIYSKSEENFGPVFSFSKTNDYYDIMYPAWSFWKGGPATKFYPTGLGRWDVHRKLLKLKSEEIPWEKKINKGFFRGSRTSSERDFLIILSQQNPDLIEANYTKNQAWKSDRDTLGIKPSDEVLLEDHCKFKYLFNFRGVAASFRFRHLFLCKSLIFHVGNEWIEFFYPLLKPWVHYIPIEPNIENHSLIKLLNFFKTHDIFAKKIANQGFETIWKHLRMSTIDCYWKRLIINYSKLLKYPIKKNPTLIEIRN